MARSQFLCVSILVWCLTGIAVAQQTDESSVQRFSSPKGYSLRPPADWKTVTAETRDEILAQAGDKYPAIRNIDLRMIDAIFFGPIVDSCAVNFNVVVTASPYAADESFASQYPQLLRDQIRRTGMSVADITVHTDRVNNQPCVIADYHLIMGDNTLQQRQYILFNHGRMYCVTFTCAPSYAEPLQPTMQSVMAGFSLEKPTARMTLPGIPPLVLDALIVGVVGVVIGLIVWAVQKKPAARRKP